MISRTWQGYQIKKYRKGTKFPLYVRKVYRGEITWTTDYLFGKFYSEATAKRLDAEIDDRIKKGEFADMHLIADTEGSKAMAKYYKRPSGCIATEEVGHDAIEEGMIVYLNPCYVAEDASPRRYVTALLGDGHVLLADDKRMFNRGEGYIYGLYSIAYYKPFK